MLNNYRDSCDCGSFHSFDCSQLALDKLHKSVRNDKKIASEYVKYLQRIGDYIMQNIGVPFEEIIPHLRAGKKVTRIGWGRDCWIHLSRSGLLLDQDDAFYRQCTILDTEMGLWKLFEEKLLERTYDLTFGGALEAIQRGELVENGTDDFLYTRGVNGKYLRINPSNMELHYEVSLDTMVKLYASWRIFIG